MIQWWWLILGFFVGVIIGGVGILCWAISTEEKAQAKARAKDKFSLPQFSRLI